MVLELGTRLATLGKSKNTEVVLYREKGGRLVAVKRKLARLSTNSVLREKSALMQCVGCKGVIDLFRAARDTEYLYFILEPALGGPLHRHIRFAPGGALSTEQALFYTVEVIAALTFLHGKLVAHRDVKGSNIVLDAAGHIKILPPVKLVDLGSASDVLKSRQQRMLTFCGTFHCMAPEVALLRHFQNENGSLEQGYTMACDWWSLGVLVYEMLVGAPPFGYGTGDPDKDEVLLESAARGFNPENLRRTHLSGCEAVDFLKRLLCVMECDRLGWESSEQVIQHHWIAGAGIHDFQALADHNLTPPHFQHDLGELDLLPDFSGF